MRDFDGELGRLGALRRAKQSQRASIVERIECWQGQLFDVDQEIRAIEKSIMQTLVELTCHWENVNPEEV